MVANPTASVLDLREFVKDKGKPENVSKRYEEVLVLAQKMAERIVAE